MLPASEREKKKLRCIDFFMKYKQSTILQEDEKNNIFLDSKVGSITWKHGEIPKPFFSFTYAICSITWTCNILLCVNVFFFTPKRVQGVMQHLAIEMCRFLSAIVAVTDDLFFYTEIFERIAP